MLLAGIVALTLLHALSALVRVLWRCSGSARPCVGLLLCGVSGGHRARLHGLYTAGARRRGCTVCCVRAGIRVRRLGGQRSQAHPSQLVPCLSTAPGGRGCVAGEGEVVGVQRLRVISASTEETCANGAKNVMLFFVVASYLLWVLSL